MSWKTGLEFGWWKDPRVLVDVVILVLLFVVFFIIGYAWFMG